MPTFVHPALLWGLAAVAIPVLIHLINMMRHRRVEWAAMEFLLVSQKKHRTWIIFKQLLLLLLRMAAVAAVVLMVAQPRLRSQLGNLLGGTRIHHIVLLDDSFSMSDRWADTDAFSEAKKVVERIGDNAVRQDRLQSFTLLRFSRAPRAARPAEPDLLKQPVGSEFGDKLAALLAKIKVTQTAAGPLPALQAVGQLLGDNDGEQRILYLISDFRARQWNEPAELRKELLQLERGGGGNPPDRLRRSRAAQSGDRLAGAGRGHPRGGRAVVHGRGRRRTSAPRRPGTLRSRLGEDGHGRPAVTLAEIPPGKTAKERFEVRLPNAGPHQITARLESDAVAADNYRYCAIDLPAGRAGAAGRRRRPGPRRPLSESGLGAGRAGPHRHPAADRDAALLEPQAARRFSGRQPGERRAAGRLGGRRLGEIRGRRRRRGVLPRRADATRSSSTTFCIAAARGCSPCRCWRESGTAGRSPRAGPRRASRRPLHLPRVRRQAEHVLADRDGASAISRFPTAGGRRAIRASAWWPACATARRWWSSGSFGKGRVVAFLTTAAPTWNNWARNPSFVVAMQDLQAYLSQRPGAASRGWSARRWSCDWIRPSISRRSASPRPKSPPRRRPPSTRSAAPTEC